MPEQNEPNDDQQPDEADWVTAAIHPPSPNARFAAFVVYKDGTPTVEIRAIDYLALQHVPDEEGTPLQSRVVAVVIDWTGRPRVCVLEGQYGFVALATSAAEVQQLAAQVVAQLPAAAPPPAAAAP